MLLLFLGLACSRPVPSPGDDVSGGSGEVDGSDDGGSGAGGSGDASGGGSDDSGSGGGDTDDSGGEGGDTGVSGTGFRGLIVPLYAEKCESCHGYWGSSEDPDALWSGLVEAESHALVTAGDPSESMFYTKMLSTSDPDFPSGSRMPLESDSVSSDQVSSLEAWIEDGAEESGFDAYTDIHDERRYRCESCHEYFGGDSESDMYDIFLETEVGGVRVLSPGDPSSSLLYLKITGGEVSVGAPMPLNHAYLETVELEAVEAWILAGADND